MAELTLNKEVILFEDDMLLVLDKPAGLVVHPAAGHHGDTLVDWLREYLGPEGTTMFADPERLGLVHRLDKDTSGVLVVAKNAVVQAHMGRQFHDRLVKKTYAAFIEGIPPARRGVIEAPVGRSRRQPTRMAVTGQGRPSETAFEVKEKFREVSQVALFPKTGRTHQIRVHLAAIGHPIVGDRTYGSKALWQEDFGIARPLLHAERLELAHPATGKTVSFQAPWPADMRQAQEKFRKGRALWVLAGLLIGTARVQAEQASAPAAKAAAKPAKSSAASGQGQPSPTRILKKEVASLKEEFESLKSDVASLQQQVEQIQTGLSGLNLARRLRDLEKALSEINSKTVNTSNMAEEAKTQTLDLSNKLRTQQDTLDQLRDQVDRLHREVIQQKAREDLLPPPQTSAEPPSGRGGERGK